MADPDTGNEGIYAEFTCSRCDEPLVEIKRGETSPSPYGPRQIALFICAGGHHCPVTTTPGYIQAFDQWQGQSEKP